MGDGNNILITGGTGFIGSRLALACLSRGQSVRVLAQTNNDMESSNAAMITDRGGEVVIGSVTDRETLDQATAGVDVVYHLAAAQHEANVPDQRFVDVNVTGTRNVLEAAVQSGVRRFVHGSTIGVFGGAPGRTIDEHSPLAPTNIYGTTKLEAEKVVASYADRIPAVIVRISETYGPGDGRLVKLFRGLGGGRFFLIGRGRNLHHPIYIDDLLDGLRLAANGHSHPARPFVLAGPTPVSTRDMVAAVAAAVGKPAPRLRSPLWPFWLTAVAMEATLGRIGIQPPLHRRRLNFFVLSFAFSGDDAREAIGFVPKVGFDQGAERTARWYKETGRL